MRPVFRCTPSGTEPEALARLGRDLDLPGPARFLDPDPHGRPRAEAGGNPLSVSLSRCSGVALVALAATGRVGVDLVDPRTPQATEELRSLATPGERVWLGTLDPGAERRRLLQVWAAREALLKALGLGLAQGADTVELGPGYGEGLRPVRMPGFPGVPTGWHLDLMDGEGLAQGLLLALAWAEAAPLTGVPQPGSSPADGPPSPGG